MTQDDTLARAARAMARGVLCRAAALAAAMLPLTLAGSSIYPITDQSGALATPRRFYHFCGHPSSIDGTNAVQALPYAFTDAEGRFYADLSVADEDGDVFFRTDSAGNVRLGADTTLFARWTAKSSASYRVIVWQQKVTDSKTASDGEKKYDYVEHYTSPAVAASTQIAESLLKNFSGTSSGGERVNGKDLTSESFTGFHDIGWGSNPSDRDSVEIPSGVDGKASVRLFWKRSVGLWGRSVHKWNAAKKRYVQTFVTDDAVPPGMGFWYYRAQGGAFSVVVKEARTLD